MKRKLITVLLGMAIAVCAVSMTAFAEEYVAKIGETGYTTLQAAVNAVANGTETTITLQGNVEGDGVIVPDGKVIIFDFNGFNYAVEGNLVGSTGTETIGFQLFKGSTVNFSNGSLTSTRAKMLIQNYSNLTLYNMELDGSGMSEGYTLSNNCGNVNITGNTSITAPPEGKAFDVYYWPSGGYGDGVSVTVDTTGTIEGTIEYASEDAGTSDAAQKAILKILNGNIEGSLSTSSNLTRTGIVVSGGTFKDGSFSAYCTNGFAMQRNPETGKYELQVSAPGTLVNGTYYATLADAIAAANAIEGTDPVTIVLTEGNFAPTANEQLRITRPNVTLVGAGANKTVIDCGTFSVSGQAGILAQADNVTIQNLKVVSSAGAAVSAVKFTAIGDGTSPLPLLNKGAVKDVVIECVDGHGLNIHGVSDMSVDGLNVSGGKCGISIANSPLVTVNNTAATGTWGSVGMMYADNSSYQNPSKLVLGEGNVIASVYSERPTTAVGGVDSLTVTADSDFIMSVQENGKWVVVSRGQGVVNYVTNGTTNFKYITLEDALDAAKPGDILTIAGTLEVSKPVDVKVEGVTIKGGTLKAGPSFTRNGNDGSVLSVTANNVTLDGVTVDASADITALKYAVQFYCVTGGKMNNCTIINDGWTAVNVNGSDVAVNSGNFSLPGSYAVFELSNGGSHDLATPKLTVRGNLNISGVMQLIWTDLVSNAVNNQEQIENLPAGTTVSANLVVDGKAVYVDGAGQLKIWVAPEEADDSAPAASTANAAATTTTPVLDSTPKTGSSVVSMLPMVSIGFAALGLVTKRKLQ